MNYSWPSVRNFNLSINQALAQGRLTWGQMDVIQARSNTLVMLIFVPVRIQAPSFQVHARNATPLGESRKICIVLTGIIPPNALVTSLTRSTRTHITAEYVILISIPCSIVVNGDILFQLTNLLSKGHND